MDFYSLSVGRGIVEVDLTLKLAKSAFFKNKKSPNILYKVNPFPSSWTISNVTLSLSPSLKFYTVISAHFWIPDVPFLTIIMESQNTL